MSTNIDLDEFNAGIKRMSDVMQEFGQFAKRNKGMLERANELTRGATSAREKELEDQFKKQAANVRAFGNAVVSAATSIQSAAGQFSALNGTISLVVKSLGMVTSLLGPFKGLADGIIQAGGDLAQELTKQFDRAYGEFEKLAESGVIEKFEDLSDSTLRTRMNFADTSRVLTKFSRELSSFGGSAVAGRQRFEEIAFGSSELRVQFQKLGIGIADTNDMQLTYISRLQQQGRLEGKTNADLISGTQKYITELDQVSKLTGLNRKDVQAQRDAAMRETRFAATMADLPDKVKSQIENLNTVIEDKFGKEAAAGLRDSLSGAINTESAKAFTVQTAGIGPQILEMMKTGAIGYQEGFKLIQDAYKQTYPQIKAMGGVIGDASLLSRNVADIQRGINAKLETPEELDARRERQRQNMEATKGQNAELALTKVRLYDMAVEVDRLMVSSKTATWAMDKLSWAMSFLIRTIKKYAGDPLSQAEAAQQSAHDAARDTRKAEEKLTTAIEELRQQMAEQAKRDKKPAPTEAEVETLSTGDPRVVKARKELEAAKREEKEKRDLAEKLTQRELENRRKESAARMKQDAQAHREREAGRRKELETPPPLDAEALKKYADGVKAKREGMSEQDKAKIAATKAGKSQHTVGHRNVPGHEGLIIKDAAETTAGGPSDPRLVAIMQEFVKDFPGTKITAINDLYKRDRKPGGAPDKHDLGRAVDFAIDPMPTKEEAQLIEDYLKKLGFSSVVEGYHKKLHGTAPHFHAELAKGGIVPATPGGRTVKVAEAGQAEAVIPLNGKTMPVELKHFAYDRFAAAVARGMGTITSIPVTVKNFDLSDIPDPLDAGRTIPVELQNFQYDKLGAFSQDQAIPVEIKNNTYPGLDSLLQFTQPMPVEIQNFQYERIGMLDEFSSEDIVAAIENSTDSLMKAYEASTTKFQAIVEELRNNNKLLVAVQETLRSSKSIQQNILTYGTT